MSSHDWRVQSSADQQTPADDDAEFERALAQEMLIESATEKLLELMEREGVSRAELARRVGRNRSFMTQILDGSRNMTLRTVADLAHALGYQLELRERAEAGTARRRAFDHQALVLWSRVAADRRWPTRSPDMVPQFAEWASTEGELPSGHARRFSDCDLWWDTGPETAVGLVSSVMIEAKAAEAPAPYDVRRRLVRGPR